MSETTSQIQDDTSQTRKSLLFNCMTTHIQQERLDSHIVRWHKSDKILYKSENRGCSLTLSDDRCQTQKVWLSHCHLTQVIQERLDSSYKLVLWLKVAQLFIHTCNFTETVPTELVFDVMFERERKKHFLNKVWSKWTICSKVQVHVQVSKILIFYNVYIFEIVREHGAGGAAANRSQGSHS